MKKIKILVLAFVLTIGLGTTGIHAWSETVNSGYAREIMWVFGCTGNSNRQCTKKGVNSSSVSTNNTNRWIRSSVVNGGKTIRSPKSGTSKTINKIVWNAKNAKASGAVAVGKSNQRYHDYMKR